jgi:phage terminase large subunit-like protein
MKSRSPVPKRDHCAIARQYCADVLSGKIPACEYVKQACQRQVNDLARDWEFIFDEAKGNRVCKFIENLVHIKGSKWAGKNLILEPWQCFILTTVFGWVYKETGIRRFRRGHVEVPKGNGKSALSSGIALYMLCADKEPGAEIYSAATTRPQAKLVFDVAQAMARKCPKLCEKFGVQVNANDIAIPRTNSVFRTFSSDANSVEGCNPQLVVVDELHAHPNRELYDNLETAMGKREQNLLWSITTAGNDRSGICFEVRSYVIDILSGKKHDEAVFGIVYTIDKKDDWALESSWIKANPNWGVSVFPNDIGQKATKAMQTASAQPSFKTKHLNVWVNTAHSWMDMRKWEMCGDEELSLDDFAGKPPIDDPSCKACGKNKCPQHALVPGADCIVGMDLASRKDLVAIVLLFWKDVETVDKDGVHTTARHYYVFGTYWVPEAAVESTENSQYAGWATEGRLITSPGEINDFSLFEQELKNSSSHFNVLEIAHDPYLADMIVGHMVNEGLPTMVKVTQNVQNFSPVLKELEALVMAGRLHHNCDPILTWAVANVEVKPDHKDNIYPRKARGQDKNKIDPVIALLMALNRAMAQVESAGFEIVGII